MPLGLIPTPSPPDQFEIGKKSINEFNQLEGKEIEDLPDTDPEDRSIPCRWRNVCPDNRNLNSKIQFRLIINL